LSLAPRRWLEARPRPQLIAFSLVSLSHRAYNRTREGNFALQGLLGFDIHGKTVGVVGTGKIGV
jgi:D-lactate dehydrogenase